MAPILRFSLVWTLAVVVIAGCIPVAFQDLKPTTNAASTAGVDVVASPTPTQTVTATPEVVIPKPIPTPPVPKPVTPKLIHLLVPFATQAPLVNWDELHNEACEEASILMAQAYVQGTKISPPQAMEDKILDLVAWEESQGYSVDTTAQETVAIATKRLGLVARTSTKVSVEGIRAELERGNLVIIPAAGRRLGNPNFKRPGPLYHMLVVRGHDPASDEFITNDPGTRKGENYRYRTSVMLNAVHDWPKPGMTKDDVTDAEMEAGAKIMIVVEKP